MMQIRRIVTADDPLGEPWPPCDAGLWCVVRRLCGFTMWRAIGWVETAVNEYIEASPASAHQGIENFRSRQENTNGRFKVHG